MNKFFIIATGAFWLALSIAFTIHSEVLYDSLLDEASVFNHEKHDNCKNCLCRK